MIDPGCIADESAVLSGPDFHHIVRVLRLREGATLSLSDGLGRVYRGTIRTILRSRLEVALTESTHLPEPPPPRLVLVIGVTRGSRSEWTLQKCTELGADEIVPAVCERSVARPRDVEQKLERWREIVRQAARQCERPRIPVLSAPRPLSEALQQAGSLPGVHLIADPGARTALESVEGQLRAVPQHVAMALGPEGGFAHKEVDNAIAAGFQPIGLGPSILRAETAVVALLAIVGHLCGRMSGSPTGNPLV